MNSSSWWTKKLGNDSVPSRPLPPMPPMRPTAHQQPAPKYQPQQDIHVTDDNAYDAAMQWRGGEAMRTETQRCPNCASDLYFSRTNTGGQPSQSGMATPAPRCYACGYTQGRSLQGMPPA
jgi:hypothetical protein